MAKPDNIRAIGASPKTSGLIFADQGAGKTRLLGTGGEGTLIIRPNTEHTDSIRTPGVDEWVVNGWNDMNEVLEYSRHEAHREYKRVCLDTISGFQDIGLDDIWDGVIAQKPHRAQFGLDKGEYGVNMFRLGQWVRHMVGAPGFDFWITAHPAERSDWSANPDADVKLMPYVQGKNMAGKVCAMMNIVAYMEVKEHKTKGVQRILHTNLTEDYYAKDQFDAFPKGRLVNPTMPAIEKAIDEARKLHGLVVPKAKKAASKKKTTTKKGK